MADLWSIYMDESFVSFSERLPVGVIQLYAGTIFLEIYQALNYCLFNVIPTLLCDKFTMWSY